MTRNPNLIGRTLARLRASFRMAGMVWNSQGGQGYGWRLLLPGSQYDYEASAGDLWRNSAVAACLRWLRINFPEPILEAVREKKDNEDEVVFDHECVRLLNRPNPFHDRFVFGAAWVISAVVDGNAYALKIRSGSGKVVQLWWVPHWLIWPRWAQDGSEFVGKYQYNINGRLIDIPPSEVIHYRQGIDPRDDRKGFSELKQAVRAVVGLNECDTYTAAIMRNMGVISHIVSFDGDGVMQLDDVAVLQDQWREQFTTENRGTPLFSPRNMKVVKLGMTPEEMRLDQLPARLEDQICAAIGLPAMAVGISSGAQHKTYANYGEARKAAYEDCLIPFQKSLSECWTNQLLLPDFTGADRLRFNYSTVQCLAENETELGNRIGAQYQQFQVITRAEARAALGYDFTPEDDVYFADTRPEPVMEPGIQGEEPADEPTGKRMNRVLGLLERSLSRENGNGHWHADA